MRLSSKSLIELSTVMRGSLPIWIQTRASRITRQRCNALHHRLSLSVSMQAIAVPGEKT